MSDTFLDCGCVITENGRQLCPSCADENRPPHTYTQAELDSALKQHESTEINRLEAKLAQMALELQDACNEIIVATQEVRNAMLLELDKAITGIRAAAMVTQREADARLDFDGGVPEYRDAIRNAPLTDPVAQEWLERQLAATRAQAYRRCADYLIEQAVVNEDGWKLDERSKLIVHAALETMSERITSWAVEIEQARAALRQQTTSAGEEAGI